VSVFRIRSITAPSHFNTFYEAATLFLICQLALFIPRLSEFSTMIFGISDSILYAMPIFWILGAVLAWFSIHSPIPRDDVQRRHQGWILTRWTGQEAKFRLKAALALSVGNVLSSLLAPISLLAFPSSIATFNLGSYFKDVFPYTPGAFSFSLALWPLRLIYAGSLIGLAAFSGLSIWNLHKEIQITQSKWSKPGQYDAVKYARKGKVLVGQEFERTIQSTATKHKDEGMIDAEVSARPTARLVGLTRSFCIDLVNSVSSHMYVLGGTGFGKTQFGKALIVRMWNALRIPSLILDWKNEYSPVVAKMGGLVLKVPESFTINPLKLEGFSPILRAETAADLLIGAIKLSSLQAGEVIKVIMRLYERCGIRQESTQEENESKTPPTVCDVIEELETMRERGEFRGQKAESVGWTIDKLSLVKRIFKSEDVEFFDEALKRPCAIDLSELSDIAKMLVIYAILQRVYEHCKGMHLSKLRLLIVMDEAHLVLKTKSDEKVKFSMEPLPVRLIREGRKYGFGIVLLSQLATDILRDAAGNVAFIVAMCLSTSEQRDKVAAWIDLSNPEKEIYRTLPLGGAFIGEASTQNAGLVRVQALESSITKDLDRDPELMYARRLCRQVSPRPSKPNQTIERSSKAPTPTTPESKTSLKDWYRETMTGKPVEAPRISSDVAINSEASKPPENETLPKPEPTTSETEPEPLTPDETRILHELETKPLSIKALQARFNKLTYQELLEALNELEDTKRIQVVYIVGLQRQPLPYYAALRGEWLQSEGVKHRAMQDLAFEALGHLGARRYINADYPDIGLESAKPKTALEFETGLKKFTDIDLDKWASHVKERNSALGYERTIVVVLNVHILKKYELACKAHGLEITTMTKLLSLLEGRA